MTDLEQWMAQRAKKDEQLYERYGKPLEKEHAGEYAAIGPDGQVVFGVSTDEVLQKGVDLNPPFVKGDSPRCLSAKEIFRWPISAKDGLLCPPFANGGWGDLLLCHNNFNGRLRERLRLARPPYRLTADTTRPAGCIRAVGRGCAHPGLVPTAQWRGIAMKKVPSAFACAAASRHSSASSLLSTPSTCASNLKVSGPSPKVAS